MAQPPPARTAIPVWIWIAILAFLIIFNLDPIGDALVKIGPNADFWATNIFFIVLIAYFFWRERKKE